MHSIQLNKSINLALDTSSDIFDLMPLVLNGLNINPRYTVVSRNKYVKNLKAYASIQSLPELVLPNFEITDSDTEKLYKTLDIEWGNARKELWLYSKNVEQNLFPLGQISLINPSGYPYRSYNLMDLLTDSLAYELAEDSVLSVGMKDVGYGLLEVEDTVSIYGSYVEEIVVDTLPGVITSIVENSISLLANESTEILSDNLQRKYVLIQNNSSEEIFISLASTASTGGFKVLPNGHYEFNVNEVSYYNKISAFSSSDANLLIIEGS